MSSSVVLTLTLTAKVGLNVSCKAPSRLLLSVHRAANLFSQQGPRGGGGVPAINSWKANGNQ